jgi:hypothetical protein
MQHLGLVVVMVDMVDKTIPLEMVIQDIQALAVVAEEEGHLFLLEPLVVKVVPALSSLHTLPK